MMRWPYYADNLNSQFDGYSRFKGDVYQGEKLERTKLNEC